MWKTLSWWDSYWTKSNFRYTPIIGNFTLYYGMENRLGHHHTQHAQKLQRNHTRDENTCQLTAEFNKHFKSVLKTCLGLTANEFQFKTDWNDDQQNGFNPIFMLQLTNLEQNVIWYSPVTCLVYRYRYATYTPKSKNKCRGVRQRNLSKV